MEETGSEQPVAPMTDDDRTLERLLAAVARRLTAADRVATSPGDPLLPAIAATAAVVLDAQAASIALHDHATGRLVFVAAAGPAAGDVVGLTIGSGTGIAGYAFSTGQPLAVADVVADTRFDRTIAEATGYVPSCLLATPLIDDDGPVGVLEVLDRRGGTFTLHDLDIAGALAREATIAVRIGRGRRDAGALLRGALTELLGRDDATRSDDAATAPDARRSDDEPAIEAIVARATASLFTDDDDPTWRLVDRIARLRDVDPEAVELAMDWLDALIRHRGRSFRGGSQSRPGR